MEELICGNCNSELNFSEQEVEFYDDGTGVELVVVVNAVWCSGCGYQRFYA